MILTNFLKTEQKRRWIVYLEHKTNLWQIGFEEFQFSNS